MLQGRNGTRVAIAAAALALLAPAGAQAASRPSLVIDGAANWGVKQSFRNYVTGSFAMGGYEASRGATKAADGTIDWAPGSGTTGPREKQADVGFGGLVHFTGHGGQLDIKLSDLRVEMNGDAGVLYLDAESKGLETGEVEKFEDVDFATISAAGVPPTDSTDSLLWGPLPTTLTENGARAFAGFYDPGTALDPISFAVEKTDTPGEIEAAKKQKVGSGGGKISVAKVFCEVSECELTTPKKLKGGGISAKVSAPDTVSGGKPAKVKAKISGGDAKKLAGSATKLKGTLAVASEGFETETKVAIKVRGE